MKKATTYNTYDAHCLSRLSERNILTMPHLTTFGTTSYRAGRSDTETSLKRYKYVGKERDEETGLYYYGARYYAPWIGRWTAVDPLAEKYKNLSPYNYVENAPLKFIDPDGKGPEEAIKYLRKVLEEAPKHEALRDFYNLMARMEGEPESLSMNFKPIKGFNEQKAKPGGLWSDNDQSLTAVFDDIYGMKVSAHLSYHRKNDIRDYDTSDVDFNKGKYGKGVSGGGIKAISGFEILLKNRKGEKVMSFLVFDEEQFDKIKETYKLNTRKEFQKLLEANPKAKAYYELEKFYDNNVYKLYNKAISNDATQNDRDKYLESVKEYNKLKSQFKKKYEK